MASSGNLDIEVKLKLEDVRRDLRSLKQQVGDVGQKVDFNLDTGKARSAVRDLLSEIKIGFAREIGANAFNALVGGLEAAKNKTLELGQSVIQTGAKFEDLLATLKTTLGSQSAADAAFANIQQFAATTPFQVDEVTQAFISLKNRGIEPTNELLRKSGDIASSQGKSLQQFVEAVLDAQTGENERLKEFGIQAQKTGEQVTFTFKGVQKTVAATPEAIAQAVTSFGELQGVLGGMEERAKTFNGQLSNLQDNSERLKKTFFDGIKPALGSALELATQVTAEFQAQADRDLPQLKAQAEAFSAELKSNPELAKQLGEALNEASQAISGEILKAAKELAGFLAANPGYISETVKGLAAMAKQLLSLVDSAVKLANFLGQSAGNLKENIDAANTRSASGFKFNAEEAGIRNTIKPQDLAEFDKKAEERLGGFRPFRNVREDEEFLRKLSFELNVARAKAAEFGDASKVAFEGFKQGAAGATTAVKSQVAEVPKLTEKASKEAIAKLEEANRAAETSVRTATTNQIASIKELGLTRETEARRIAEVEKNAAAERVAAIQAEIEQVKALRASGQITPEAEQQKLLALNSELATANLARIEKVRAAENALRAEVIAGIEAQALKQKLVDNDRIAGADKVLQSLKREQDLFSARSGLEAAQGDLTKVRLENQLKITEAIGNEGAAAQLKLQIQQQEIANQERVFAAQLKSLEITQQIKAAELQRQAILDKIAIAESEIALKKLTQKEGVSKDELALQQQIIDANREKAALTNQAIADQGTFNQLAKDELITKQQATRETAQTNIAADALKTSLSGVNTAVSETNTALSGTTTAINTATNAAGQLNTAIAGMTENTKALVQQALAVKEAFRQGATAFQGSATGLGGNIQTAAKGADGIIGSVGGQTVAGRQAEALAAGLEGYEKAAFIFKAKAKELESNGLINTEKVNINGVSYDYKEAGDLFGQAASKALDGQVSRFAQLVIAQKEAVALTGSVVAGRTADEVRKNSAQYARNKLVGFAGGTNAKPYLGLAKVGERGPELINATPQGVHVLSNAESRKIPGFANGTGNMEDFVNAALIKSQEELDTFRREVSNRNQGRGWSAAGYNKFASAFSYVSRGFQEMQIMAGELRKGNVLTAKAMLEKYAEDMKLNDFGANQHIAIGALSRVSAFFNAATMMPKIPKLARGVENFSGGLAYVHQGEVLANLPRGTDVIPKNVLKGSSRQNGANNISTKINNLTIQHPDPTGEAVRFLQENSRQSMRLARV